MRRAFSVSVFCRHEGAVLLVRHEIDGGWREQDDLDARLARGEIDEEAWYRATQAAIVPRHLSAAGPRAQSGHSGDEPR